MWKLFTYTYWIIIIIWCAFENHYMKISNTKFFVNKINNADYSSTFNDPSSNPATAIPPSADSAQDRAQGVSGTSNEFIKMVPDDVFQTYNYYYIINWWDFTAFLDYMYIYNITVVVVLVGRALWVPCTGQCSSLHTNNKLLWYLFAGLAFMWAKITTTDEAPMGAYLGHYRNSNSITASGLGPVIMTLCVHVLFEFLGGGWSREDNLVATCTSPGPFTSWCAIPTIISTCPVSYFSRCNTCNYPSTHNNKSTCCRSNETVVIFREIDAEDTVIVGVNNAL